MLISFRVSNFLSFDEMQEFSMIPGKTAKKIEHLKQGKDNLKLLKFSALYGANSSGKSNLLKAIIYAKSTILDKLQYSPNSYCRICSKNKEKVSTFDFEIKIDNKCYAYGFDIFIYKNSIQKEWLLELGGEIQNTIYSREIGKDVELNTQYFDKDILKRLQIYAEDIKNQDDVLFLKVMNTNKDSLYSENKNNNLSILKKVFSWFKDVLTIITPDTKKPAESYYATEEGLNKIAKVAAQFGTGISKCKTQKINKLDITKIPKPILEDVMRFMEVKYNELLKMGEKEPKLNAFLRANNDLYILEKQSVEKLDVKTVKFEHKNNDGEYLFSEESDGTIRILDIIEILLNTSVDKVYFVDELDRCLHPKLTCKFVDTFLNTKEDADIQLFVTTHESRLLNLDLLRRDEVWFANREENAATKIYSLEEYNKRFDKQIDKAYLDGRFGGVPMFKNCEEITE